MIFSLTSGFYAHSKQKFALARKNIKTLKVKDSLRRMTLKDVVKYL